MVCVFARKTSESLASLVKQIDEKIGDNSRLCSFVVIMSKEPGKTPEELRKLADDKGIKHVPLTMVGDPNGPGDYELSGKAEITVLMWKSHTVKFNHAFKGELTDENIKTIMADIPKLVGN